MMKKNTKQTHYEYEWWINYMLNKLMMMDV